MDEAQKMMLWAEQYASRPVPHVCCCRLETGDRLYPVNQHFTKEGCQVFASWDSDTQFEWNSGAKWKL